MNTNNITDTYQRITDYVISQLEQGEIVWKKGWNALGLPKNIATGHYYQGWNIFFLNFVTSYLKYKTPYFITYKQALGNGGTIRMGEKGFQVIWWATIEDKSQAVKNEDEEENFRTYRVPKVHTVFNIAQTQGIEFPKVESQFRSITLKIYACEHILKNMPGIPSIRHQGDKAFYNPITDTITLPPVERFHSDEAYYKTLFHELAHSTGHSKRLSRKELVEDDGFGKENYSKEELTAELTAAFLCAVCGIEQPVINNSATYIQGWLKVLKEDKKLILKASAQAHAAANYIMNKTTEKVVVEIEESTFIN